MPQPRTKVSVQALEVTAESLLVAVGSLTKVVAALKEAGMEEAWMPWTNQHWAAVDRILASGPMMESEAILQIAAHKAGRKSNAEIQRERGQKSYAKTKEANAGQPPKKRGRPRKNP